jgi:hypothetical protein
MDVGDYAIRLLGNDLCTLLPGNHNLVAFEVSQSSALLLVGDLLAPSSGSELTVNISRLKSRLNVSGTGTSLDFNLSK